MTLPSPQASATKAHGGAALVDPTTHVGGAWETVVECAITNVVSFLAASTDPLEPSDPLSQCMLLLLDHGSLRDIVVERNYNRLCGSLGCPHSPQGLHRAQPISFAWGSASDEDEDEDEEREVGRGEEGDLHIDVRDRAPDDEIVYADDIVTHESFRLAHVLQRRLARIRRRCEAAERTRQRPPPPEAHRATEEPLHPTRTPRAATGSVIRRPVGHGGIFGAVFSDRFCSPQCLDIYENELRPHVFRYFQYNHPQLLNAIANLFPNLRVAALQQLAGAHAAPHALVGNITEKSLPMVPATASDTIDISYDSAAQLGAEVLGKMQSMITGQPRWHAQGVVRCAVGCDGSAKAIAPLAPQDGASDAELLRSRTIPQLLRGPLLILDFLLKVSSLHTRHAFLCHYAARGDAIGEQSVKKFDCRHAPKPLVFRVVQPLLHDLGERLAAASDHGIRPLAPPAAEGLRVNPLVQQQRRELFASHTFSVATAAALSRLLCLDVDVLLEELWHPVWTAAAPAQQQRAAPQPPASVAYAALSLCHSLSFAFPIPASLLQPVTTSPEALLLALVCTVATACATPAAWAPLIECEESLVELMEAMGITEEDVTVCLRALVIGDDV